jgi:hypothetical protein
MQDYSQTGEQQVILDFFRDTPYGVFIEAGGGDGLTYSNTYALELLGWHGVVIEPHQVNAESCRSARRVPVIEKACLPPPAGGEADERSVTLYVAPIRELHTLNPQFWERVKQMVENCGMRWQGFAEVQVTGSTLDRMVEDAGLDAVDFLSIDTEWANFDTLCGSINTIANFKPALICIEVNSLAEEEGVRTLLHNLEYTLHARTDNNQFYRRRT